MLFITCHLTWKLCMDSPIIPVQASSHWNWKREEHQELLLPKYRIMPHGSLDETKSQKTQPALRPTYTGSGYEIITCWLETWHDGYMLAQILVVALHLWSFAGCLRLCFHQIVLTVKFLTIAFNPHLKYSFTQKGCSKKLPERHQKVTTTNTTKIKSCIWICS